MFDWLFPNWSNPAAIVALVGSRVSINVYLTVTVADAVGRRTLLAAGMATATLLSTVLMVLLLRPSGFGLRASYVEVLLQVALVAVAGYVVYAYPSGTRRTVTVAVLVAAIALLLVMVPVYGERFVAP